MTQDMASTIRAMIRRSGLSAYELAKRSGVDRARIGRFLKGERGITLASAQRLCDVLGLRLVKG